MLSKLLSSIITGLTMSNVPASLLTDIYEDYFSRYKIDSTGSVKAKGNRKAFKDKVKEVFVKLPEECESLSLQEFRDEITDRIKNTPEPTAGGCTDDDIAVDEFLASLEISISADGQRIKRAKCLDLTLQELKDSIKDFANQKNKPLTEYDIRYSGDGLYLRLTQRLQDGATKVWQDLQKDIAFQQKAGGRRLQNNLDKVLRAMRRTDNGKRFEVDMRMLAHFIWTIKRRIVLQDFFPANPLMIVFHGLQGGGKTSFVENFLSRPLRGKMCCPDLSVITDPREFKKYVDNALVCFDELSTASLDNKSRQNLPEKLKSLITSKDTQERMYFSQSQKTFDILATFCATSNKHIAETICDPTGMRRFWMINDGITADTPQFDWEALEEINWLELWRGVNEHKENGYITTEYKHRDLILKEQDEYCVSPSFRQWFDEAFQLYTEPGLSKKYAKDMDKDEMYREKGVEAFTKKRVYDIYTETMQDWGSTPVRLINFEKYLIKMGVVRVRKSRTHARTQCFVLKTL